MDVRFDSVAAEQLLKQMNIYCTGIVDETKHLLMIVNESYEWEDNQMKSFRNNMTVLAGDLEKILKFESEYMNTFGQRIQELKR